MYKYIWIVIMIVVYVIWTIFSIKDILECIRKYGYKDLEYAVEEYTSLWFISTLFILFITSLMDFVSLMS